MNADRLNEIRGWIERAEASKDEPGWEPLMFTAPLMAEVLAALDAAEQRAADAEKGRQIANEGWDAAEQRAEQEAEGHRVLMAGAKARVAQSEQQAADLDAELVNVSRQGAKAEQRAVQAEQERDEWQQLATRLAEEAGVDAEAMLAQARAEAKP